MFLRALAYLLLPIFVIGGACVLGYVVPARLFPHWSADAHATVAMIVVPVVAVALMWGVAAYGHRRGGDVFTRSRD
jgi:hypothetical protein